MKYLLLFCGLFACASAFAQADTNIPTTKILFEETSYDFGTIQSGEKAEHTYTFTNMGTEPLILMDAKGSCGCTVPEWPREPIAPGESGSITVVFDSKNKSGRRNQKVTITANTEPPQTFIYLTGEVIKDQPDLIEVDEEPVVVPDFLEKEDFETIDCFAIYPNPTADFLQLDVHEQAGKAAEVKIFAESGQLVERRSIASIPDGPITFDVSNYASGSYVATIQIGQRKPLAKCFFVAKR